MSATTFIEWAVVGLVVLVFVLVIISDIPIAHREFPKQNQPTNDD